MKPIHLLLCLAVAATWGVNFVVIHVGIGAFPPLLFAALRFLGASLPVLVLPRPKVPWSRLVVIGTALFTGQFGFLFTGMKVGMPAGLASITLQTQALFTVLFAIVFLKEKPTLRLRVGCGIVFAGLTVIAMTTGVDGFTPLGLALILCAACSWGAGNILLRTAPRSDMLPLIAWLSLVPPLPLLALSLLLEGPAADWAALVHVGWPGIGALAYIVLLSTIGGFGAWGYLLKLYPASQVAPFSALVPVFGTLSAALLLGERFPAQRLAGMAAILVGLLVVVWPARSAIPVRPAEGPAQPSTDSVAP
jgi:O-acetylserine/cysteine efflux transporter